MLIPVTIDVRDLDPTAGPAPIGARVAFARLSPAVVGGTLVTVDAVTVALDDDGHGSVQLTAGAGYWVHCYGFNGFGASFAVMAGSDATSLGEMWRSSQIDPAGFAALPVPQSVEQALADLRAQIGAGGGGGAGPAGFQYLQSTAAASWSIPHAFGRRPNVELYTLAGERVFTDLTATTSAVYVTFPSPTSGYAVLT